MKASSIRRPTAALVVGAIGVHALFVLASSREPVIGHRVPIGLVLALLPLAALALRDKRALHVCLALALVAGWALVGAPRMWPLHLAGPLAIYGAITLAAPPLRQSVGWLRRGRITRATVVLTLTWVALSCTALVTWFFLLEPDLRDVRAMIPDVHGVLLIVGCVVFAVINAALEEILWRGVLTAGLEASGVPWWSAIFVQALSFGVFHISGVPRGALGVVMAFFYGAMMGIVRRQSNGMLAPFAAHIVADVTIFVLVVSLFS